MTLYAAMKLTVICTVVVNYLLLPEINQAKDVGCHGGTARCSVSLEIF